MASERVSEILIAFARREDRTRAAEKLARALGAQSLLVFVRDAELETLLPATGFPQTIRGGPAFREFLRSCVGAGTRQASVDYPEAGTPALAYTISDGTTLLFSIQDVFRHVAPYIPHE